jgi:hypothetical protein
LLPKKDIPPILPVAWQRGTRWRGLRPGLLLVICTYHNDGLLTWSHVSKLLAGLSLDHSRIVIVMSRLYQPIMLYLYLLKFVLFGLQLLHELAIRPGLNDRSK